ncbi:MAG: hypothetical protein ACLUD2_06590 [Clostridium sp.]
MVPQISSYLWHLRRRYWRYASAMADFIFMEEKRKIIVNSPNAIDGNRVEVRYSSAAFQSRETGLVDFTGSEEDILSQIRSGNHTFRPTTRMTPSTANAPTI